MANITFNIEDNSIEITPPEFSADLGELAKQVFGYENTDVYPAGEDMDESITKSMGEGATALIGHPVFMTLVLEETKYDVLVNGVKKEGGIKVNRMVLPLVILEASRTKAIVTTSIEGRNGTIKEFSNLGDYDISIKGVLIGDDGQYPERQVKALSDFESCPVAIGVTNEFFRYINVSKLVIKKINWKGKEGYQNLQAFELDCISDEQVALTLEDKK